MDVCIPYAKQQSSVMVSKKYIHVRLTRGIGPSTLPMRFKIMHAFSDCLGMMFPIKRTACFRSHDTLVVLGTWGYFVVCSVAEFSCMARMSTIFSHD